MSPPERSWFREAVVYEIYPRSFADSDGDGVGDLCGVADRVDYLDELGVDVVWLTPIYDSPQVDNGYDIRDYRAIDPTYGTMDDWRELRDRLHDREIRLVMDLVLNHTSDEHEWFQRSRRGETPYDDYYVWRDGDPDERPNNWESLFGGPAWAWDERREAWHLHLFHERMPDLNWRNPELRAEAHDVVRWWLERGVDGFRLDVINLLSKTEGLPDGDPTEEVTGWRHFVTEPTVHEYVDELHEEVLAPHDAITVGETIDVSPADARRFVVEDGLDAVFPFEHVELDAGGAGPWDVANWDLADLGAVTERWQTALDGGWIGLYLENHDQPRAVSRFGDESHRAASATLLGTYLFTLRGTPFVYQGQEIGMTNAEFESLAEFRDPATVERVERAIERGDVEAYQAVREDVQYWSRDNARTPMQWSDDANAGFTDGEPWIKVNRDYPDVNVARQRGDEDSVLGYYRRLADLREVHPVAVYGEYEPVLEEHPDVLAYLRRGDDFEEALLVLLHFDDGDATADVGEAMVEEYGAAALEGRPELLLANYDVPERDPSSIDFRPYEARVYAFR